MKKVKEDGTTVYVSEDGREYKSKSGAWKRNQKLKSESAGLSSDEVTKEAGQPEVETRKSSDRDSSPSEPSEEVNWIDMDFGDAPIVEVIPAPLKKIKPRGTGKASKKQKEAERQMNEGILVTGYKTGDYLMTRYKRGILDDPNAEAISHAEDDYIWISGVTQDALDANGLNIAGAIGPSGLAVAANSYWFGAPMLKIQKEAQKSPFQGRIGGAVGRMIERIPFLGKRLRERRLRVSEAAEVNEIGVIDNDESS